MSREPADPLRLDYLIKAGAIHSMTGETYRCVGVRGPEIVAVSADAAGLDDLAGGGISAPGCGVPGWNRPRRTDWRIGHPRSKMHSIASLAHSPSQ